MTDTFLYMLLTRIERKEAWEDPVEVALNQVLDDTNFRFYDAATQDYASRAETFTELKRRFRYRIDLICNDAPANTFEEQYDYILEEVYEAIKLNIEMFSCEERELDYIPF